MNYDQLVRERDHAARMCAVYTAGGQYDLAKKKADEFVLWDYEIAKAIGTVPDTLAERVSRDSGHQDGNKLRSIQ